MVILKPVDVAVFAGQDSRSAGAANGIAAVISQKDGAFLGDTVNGRGPIDDRTVRADGLARVIIGHNKKDVRSFLTRSGAAAKEQRRKSVPAGRRCRYAFKKKPSIQHSYAAFN